jgi:hypothetical protein
MYSPRGTIKGRHNVEGVGAFLARRAVSYGGGNMELQDSYVRLCRTMDEFYRLYMDILLLNGAGAATATKRAYLFAAFTTATDVAYTYGFLCDAIHQQAPSPTRAQQLAEIAYMYVHFRHTLAVLCQRVAEESSAAGGSMAVSA